ncbi:peptidase A4 family-domain-containing protein [Lanmaoa asiatica]|nr:peptidase A4 family-domain-containing protein [Lanmaoa asiatica]
MIFNVALFSSLLLVPVVLAVPSGLDTRVARRREGRQSQVSGRLEKAASDVSNTAYTTNWAGAVWGEGDGTFTSVIGTFVVPTPSGASGDSASAWVGIDGDTCNTAILQTGVDFSVSSNGGHTYTAWYEWFPDYAYDFSDISISAGDTIKLNVTAFSTTSGIAIVENVSKGQTVSKTLTSTVPLCGQNAEWIVEDYTVGSSLVPFANFGTVTFTNAMATGTGTYTPSGATIFDIDQNNQVLTSVSTSGSSATIKHL